MGSTSKTDEANAFLRAVLSKGPRSAAEILAAAEGANISERTMQRAATRLGIVKTKTGFDRGWTWALPTSNTETERTTAVDASDSETCKIPIRLADQQATIERAKFIAAMINRWTERRMRTRGRVYWQDPRIGAWAANGIKDFHLKEAFELAVSDDSFAGAVTVGMLERHLETVMADEGATL